LPLRDLCFLGDVLHSEFRYCLKNILNGKSIRLSLKANIIVSRKFIRTVSASEKYGGFLSQFVAWSVISGVSSKGKAFTKTRLATGAIIGSAFGSLFIIKSQRLVETILVFENVP
jgi:hypothetical protein